MPTKHKKQLHKPTKTDLMTFKEVLSDYKTGKKEAKETYLKTQKGSKFKNDELLATLPNFISKKDLKGGVEHFLKGLKEQNIEVEELSLLGAKKRLSKGKKLTQP